MSISPSASMDLSGREARLEDRNGGKLDWRVRVCTIETGCVISRAVLGYPSVSTNEPRTIERNGKLPGQRHSLAAAKKTALGITSARGRVYSTRDEKRGSALCPTIFKRGDPVYDGYTHARQRNATRAQP